MRTTKLKSYARLNDTSCRKGQLNLCSPQVRGEPIGPKRAVSVQKALQQGVEVSAVRCSEPTSDSQNKKAGSPRLLISHLA